MKPDQPKRRKSADAPPKKYVMASVRLDVSTHARLSAAAALAGVDKSAWMSRVIGEALAGVIVIDRRKPDGHVDSSMSEGSAD